MTQLILPTACLALFKDKKLLCVKPRGKDVFHFVGGRYEGTETDIECLSREVKEEIDCEVVEETVSLIAEFSDAAHGRENTLVIIKLFSAEIIGNPKPSTEIDLLEFIDTSVNQNLLTDVAKNKVFPWLKKHNYIN